MNGEQLVNILSASPKGGDRTPAIVLPVDPTDTAPADTAPVDTGFERLWASDVVQHEPAKSDPKLAPHRANDTADHLADEDVLDLDQADTHPEPLILILERMTGVTASVPEMKRSLPVEATPTANKSADSRLPSIDPDVSEGSDGVELPEGDAKRLTGKTANSEMPATRSLPPETHPAKAATAPAELASDHDPGASPQPSEHLQTLAMKEQTHALPTLPQVTSVHQTRPVMRQITDAIVTTFEDQVEITLSPEELGRIRMTVMGNDRTPNIAIWVERPEVMNLIRRNAATLQEQFAEAGFDGATFEFHDEPPSHPDSQKHRGSRDSVVSVAPPSSQANPTATGRVFIDGRIDIRL
ncbi:flagellar hook-length control protein FliK [Paracoccus sp. Z330]|uniref:Flagellar hook-length control protein FliK n=1 Tax=Paracoccus onchidii TaxID=3017813 RepID=A0ABT4ZIQ1_9RHOB|nr:flagellar hook-length control protein FliK [Paracoccus onchidii]MDB6179225.1 flagellar hook-length control protein FliK [Paracoccus onchidii]